MEDEVLVGGWFPWKSWMRFCIADCASAPSSRTQCELRFSCRPKVDGGDGIAEEVICEFGDHSSRRTVKTTGRLLREQSATFAKDSEPSSLWKVDESRDELAWFNGESMTPLAVSWPLSSLARAQIARCP